MTHKYFSERAGLHPHPNGLALQGVIGLFVRVYDQLCEDGYFTEAFGFFCVDSGHNHGRIRDVDLEILLSVRKNNLWPLHTASQNYSEDDFFDIIEFLFGLVSKPVNGMFHQFNDCGMHWSTFDQIKGQRVFRDKVNSVLSQYERRFALSESGEVLMKPDHGFEAIFSAKIPTNERSVVDRMNAAVFEISASWLWARR